MLNVHYTFLLNYTIFVKYEFDVFFVEYNTFYNYLMFVYDGISFNLNLKCKISL